MDDVKGPLLPFAVRVSPLINIVQTSTSPCHTLRCMHWPGTYIQVTYLILESILCRQIDGYFFMTICAMWHSIGKINIFPSHFNLVALGGMGEEWELTQA